MNENDNIENNDQQEDQQPCCEPSSCSDSGNCTGKMKYAAFGLIMLLAVGVAAHALIEKNKNPNASTCGSNTACGDISSCDLAPASKEADAGCPMQGADSSTCTMKSDSDAAGYSTEPAACPSKKDCCGSEACKDKAKACGKK